MQKILIVGGAGYVGGFMTDLLSTDNSVLVYDNLLYEKTYFKEIPFQFGDVRDTQALDNTLSDFQPDVVIWLAALVGDGACQIAPELTEEINFQSLK